MRNSAEREFGTKMAKTETFLFYLLKDYTHMAFSCAVEPLRIANWVAGKELYKWELASENGENVACSNGSVMLVDHGFEDRVKSDRLFVLSGLDTTKHISKKLISALRRERSHGAKIGGLCAAAFVLAEAGFLEGIRVALHWDHHDAFMENYPDVHLVRNVFVADEKFVTASGGTATADLMLHLIGEAHGEELAIEVADQMVYNTVRESSAEQKVSLQARHGMRNTRLSAAIQCMNDTIEDPISTAAISEKIGISTRQLERLFGRHLNCSPSKYYLDLRLQKARKLLLQSECSVTEVAVAAGFKSTTHFARVYRGTFGVAPGSQRARIT